MQEGQQMKQITKIQIDAEKHQPELKSDQQFRNINNNPGEDEASFDSKKKYKHIPQCLFCLIATMIVLFLVTFCGLLLLIYHTPNSGNNVLQIDRPINTPTPAPDSNPQIPIPPDAHTHSPTPEFQTFTNTSHNTQHFGNIYSYLEHNKAHRILEMFKNQQEFQTSNLQKYKIFEFQFVTKEENINGLLQKSVKVGKREGKKEKNQDQGEEEEEDGVVWGDRFDWIQVWDVFSFLMTIADKNKDIGLLTKYGISLRIPKDINIKQQNIDQKLNEYFSKINLIYEQPKSLSLSQSSGQQIRIYIKFEDSEFQLPMRFSSSLAIHSVLRLTQNIPYLRQWVGYHIAIGFKKIFIYDNTHSQKSELQKYDKKVTQKTNKNGMYLSCVNDDQQQVWQMFKDIWETYYWNIVYIRWEPKDQSGAVIYGQTQALVNYLQNFGNVCKFTGFIDPDQFIFSPSNEKIIDFLNMKVSQNITSLKLRSTHFMSRFCSPNMKVTDIKYYMPAYQRQTKQPWSAKIIALTKHFKPLGIHDGSDTVGNQQTVNSNLLRINHYNFDFWALKEGREMGLSAATQFKEDDSIGQMYAELVKEACKNFGCSERFRLNCPKGKQYKYCLKATDTFPTDLNLTDFQKQLQSSKY